MKNLKKIILALFLMFSLSIGYAGIVEDIQAVNADTTLTAEEKEQAIADLVTTAITNANGDLATIEAIIADAIGASPGNAVAITTAAITASPGNAVAITTAAVTAAPNDQAAAITDAAITAAPEQGDAIAQAGIDAAPDQTSEIINTIPFVNVPDTLKPEVTYPDGISGS